MRWEKLCKPCQYFFTRSRCAPLGNRDHPQISHSLGVESVVKTKPCVEWKGHWAGSQYTGPWLFPCTQSCCFTSSVFSISEWTPQRLNLIPSGPLEKWLKSGEAGEATLEKTFEMRGTQGIRWKEGGGSTQGGWGRGRGWVGEGEGMGKLGGVWGWGGRGGSSKGLMPGQRWQGQESMKCWKSRGLMGNVFGLARNGFPDFGVLKVEQRSSACCDRWKQVTLSNGLW